MNFGIELISKLLAIVAGVVLHEYAHGKAAEYLGDPTAKTMGRLSFNPVKHLDPFGSVILPLFLILSKAGFVFGWAKPVPVNPSYFKEPRRGMAYVGAAGPLSNLALALAGSLCYRSFVFLQIYTGALFFQYFVIVNVVLAVINLVPIPPLDGSRIVAAVLPKAWLPFYDSLERYGFVILIIIIDLPGIINIKPNLTHGRLGHKYCEKINKILLTSFTCLFKIVCSIS